MTNISLQVVTFEKYVEKLRSHRINNLGFGVIFDDNALMKVVKHPNFNYREDFEMLCGSNTFSKECERHERVLQTIERERMALQFRRTKAKRQQNFCSRIVEDSQRIKTDLV